MNNKSSINTVRSSREMLLPEVSETSNPLFKYSELKPWITSIETASNPIHDDPHFITQFLSRYGLKSSKDVIQFLKSPGGRITLSLIHARFEENLHKKEQREKNYEQFIHLLMGLMYKKKHHNHIKKMINQAVKHEIKQKPRAKNSTESIAEKISTQFLSHYAMSAQLLQEELEKYLKKLDTLGLEIESQQRLLSYTDKLEHFLSEDPLTQRHLIQDKLNELHTQTEAIALSIGSLLEEGRDDEAGFLLIEHQHLHLARILLQQLNDHLNGTKHLLNTEGEIVSSFKDANYILSPNSIVIMDKGKYYLLRAGQDFATLNQEEKNEAEQHYQKAQPELVRTYNIIESMNQSVKHYKNLLNEKKTTYEDSDDLEKKLLQLTYQLYYMSEAEQAIAHSMPQKTPKPVPATTENLLRQSSNKLLKLLANREAFRNSDTILRAGHNPSEIHKAQLQLLLTNLARWGRNPYNPSLNTPIQSPNPFSKTPR